MKTLVCDALFLRRTEPGQPSWYSEMGGARRPEFDLALREAQGVPRGRTHTRRVPRHIRPTLEVVLMDCRGIHHLQCLLLGAVLAMCVIGLLCLYAIYYYVFCVGRPRVVCSDRRTLRALRRHCPALFEPYWPTAWAPQAHMQTVLREAIQGSPRGVQGRR